MARDQLKMILMKTASITNLNLITSPMSTMEPYTDITVAVVDEMLALDNLTMAQAYDEDSVFVEPLRASKLHKV